MTGSEDGPLKVLISGAGIGGLAAAIALRQAGHNVTLFEQSRFLNEQGVAIQLAPNANGLVRRLGLVPETKGAIKAEWVAEYSADGALVFEHDSSRVGERFAHPWQTMHRVDLHSGLKDIAVAKEGKGTPANIVTSSRVVDADVENNTVVLKNGERHSGDVIIGADGVHSTLRSVVLEEPSPPVPSGQAAFRFLLPVSKIRADPVTAQFVAKPGRLQLWMGNNKRIVIYPCRHNLLLNFVCCFPDTGANPGKEDWSQSADKSEMLDLFRDFYPPLVTLISKAPENEIKLWQLLDLPALRTWVKGRVALMGDAAHPFLPYQGQGGAQAIEDGVALAALLPMGTRKEEVPERLKLYQECRYERATRLQEVSRMLGLYPKEGKNKFDSKLPNFCAGPRYQ